MSALEKDAWRITFSEVKAAAEDIIEEARKGRMFILVDDEDRENEGDLVIPAQCATPEAINFMAKHARGLICLALTRERVEQLGLALMAQNNGTRHQTAFTVSIEAREGVTTGISAADRARTVAVAIDPSCGPQDIVTPGHVFPLVARDGGTLERTGHTERGRDGERVPLPWSGVAPPYGFTTGTSTWLPMPEGWASLTVEAESAEPDSMLALYQQTLMLRRKTAELRTDDFTWIDAPESCLAYRRGSGFVVVVNAGDQPAPLPSGDVALASGPLSDGLLPPDTAVWIRV